MSWIVASSHLVRDLTECGPHSALRGDEEGVIAVDLSQGMLVDSVTEMPNSLSPDLLTVSADGSVEGEDESSKLTLAYENLYEIPRTIMERFSDHIRYLDISHNKITNLDPLVHFKHLTSLIADNNPITENCTLPPLPQLQLLWLNHCQIGSLYPWVGKLKRSCPSLQHLCLMDNPAAPSCLNGGTFYEYLQYRLFVISQFPSLNHLDDRKVTEDQRLEAHRLYKRPFVERLIRPGSGGLSHLMHTSFTWNNVQNRLATLWGKERQENRNLMI